MRNCYITTTETLAKKYPLEFLGLSVEQEQEARAEYDYIEKVQKEVYNNSITHHLINESVLESNLEGIKNPKISNFNQKMGVNL